MPSSATVDIRLDKKAALFRIQLPLISPNVTLASCPEHRCQAMVARNLNLMGWREWSATVSGPWLLVSLTSWAIYIVSPAFPIAISHVSVMDGTVGGNSRNGGLKRQRIFVDLEEPEDELTDLLTYTCSITGQKRCPPCLQLDCSQYCYPGPMEL